MSVEETIAYEFMWKGECTYGGGFVGGIEGDLRFLGIWRVHGEFKLRLIVKIFEGLFLDSLSFVNFI